MISSFPGRPREWNSSASWSVTEGPLCADLSLAIGVSAGIWGDWKSGDPNIRYGEVGSAAKFHVCCAAATDGEEFNAGRKGSSFRPHGQARSRHRSRVPPDADDGAVSRDQGGQSGFSSLLPDGRVLQIRRTH